MYIKDLVEDLKKSDDEDNEVFEFEYAFDEEMLIVNHQEGFSYNMCYEDDVYSVATKLNEQQATIKSKDKQLERLYNYFQDYLKDEMSGNAFSEMWDFVKEDEKWEDE